MRAIKNKIYWTVHFTVIDREGTYRTDESHGSPLKRTLVWITGAEFEDPKKSQQGQLLIYFPSF
jgi:hypothetical protein